MFSTPGRLAFGAVKNRPREAGGGAAGGGEDVVDVVDVVGTKGNEEDVLEDHG